MIEVEDLGKMYTVRVKDSPRYLAFRDVLMHKARAPARAASKLLSKSSRATADIRADAPTDFWALRDVTFDVHHGEVIGIIGRNGAGKSTLLKLLSQITDPTAGRIRLRGRVASLLEVGTGFHPELTGRENVFLNGSILGMHRHEIERKFDEIVEFAEIERFLDTPVKRYSSGMYVRLAFAVAAHLEPDILIVDEVLAVGDAEFQKKCLGRMDSVAQSGRTVLFVSHNMATMQRLCGRGILLEQGRLAADGPIGSVIARYNASSSAGADVFDPTQRSGTGWASIGDMRLVDEGGNRVGATASDLDLRIEIDVAVADEHADTMSLRGLVLELMFFNDAGHPLMSIMNVDDPGVPLPATRSCTITMRLSGPTFVPGRYRIDAVLGIPYLQHVDELVGALSFEVHTPVTAWRPYDLYEIRGNCCRIAAWNVAGN